MPQEPPATLLAMPSKAEKAIAEVGLLRGSLGAFL